MGSELRRQLRKALGPEIKGLQRAVALEIADDARYDDAWRYDADKGRRSKVRLADLVEWTAAKDELSVREMLRRLSVAGWEFRLPIGKGRDGRLLYAVPGAAMQFRVPDFEAPTVVGAMGQEGPTTVGPMGSQGPTVVGEGPTTVGEGPTVVGEGPTVVGPPSPVLLLSSPLSPSLAGAAEQAGIAATEGPDADASQQEEIQGLPIQEKPKRATAKKDGSKHEAADGLAASFWERYGKGRAQSFMAVRTVIRKSIDQGVDRDELAHCLGAIGETRNTVSAGTIQYELGQRTRQNRPSDHKPYQDPEDASAYHQDW